MASCGGPKGDRQVQPPVAERIEKQLIMHGDTRLDFYYWMRDRDNPRLIEHLHRENDYVKSVMRPTEDLQQKLFAEMKGRIKQDEASAPYFDNGYYYYTRFEQGGEYPLYCRKKGSLDAEEQVMIDVPQLAANHSYYRVGSFDVSPDNRFVAFTVDTVGRRQYTIYIKDLQHGKIRATGIELAAGDAVWAADNQHLFFTTIDPVTLRYEKVFRYDTHQNNPPEEVYYEADDTYYYMGVSKTKDGKYLTIHTQTTLSSEVLLLESNNPLGSFRVFQPRQRDMIYDIEHLNGTFYIITNLDAQNFRLMQTPASHTRLAHWREVIPHRGEVLLENMEVFNDYLVVQERQNGLRQMRIIQLSNGREHYLDFAEEAYTASIHINRQMDTDVFRFSYTSLTTPFSILDYHMQTREQNQIWQQTVLGDFQAEKYETRRLYAPSRDGKEIPVTLVYRKDLPKDEPSPLLQFGYGSYGISVDPRFNSNLISLLDRGFTYAIAHIRGGQELGRQWYDDGKLLQKQNTFHDFIDVSEFLISQNYTTADQLFASGGSAGGLLMGAIINMRPDLYKGIVAGVPFVDVVTTMLDETIPLTTSEYDEWGNPNLEEYYHYMLSYSPYDQISRQAYPHVLITSGLYDSQVQYWEPTKWAAKLREYNTGDTRILLHTNMEAGHSGASGRFQRLRELALEYAFILKLTQSYESNPLHLSKKRIKS